jgi:hypothetical protein
MRYYQLGVDIQENTQMICNTKGHIVSWNFPSTCWLVYVLKELQYVLKFYVSRYNMLYKDIWFSATILQIFWTNTQFHEHPISFTC